MIRGFLVHSWVHRGQFRGAGRLEDGRSFALMDRHLLSALDLPGEEGQQAQEILGSRVREFRKVQAFSGESRVLLLVPAGSWDSCRETLFRAGLHPGADRPRPGEDYLTQRGIKGGVEILSSPVPGRQVEAVFSDPSLNPSDTPVPLRWLSLDIETSREGEVRSAALVTRGPGVPFSEILFLPDFAGEADLLENLGLRVRALDPDIITGWNVVDFDLAHLAGRYAHWEVPFRWGRTDEDVRIKVKAGSRTTAFIPGRQAVDALKVARMSGRRFDDFSLDTVASEVLNSSKTVSLRGEEKLAELDRLYQEEPQKFCEYCLQDARLVLDILEKTGLGELTVRRAALTGVEMDLAWTSIPPFERIYALELAKLSTLPPPKDPGTVSGAAGGMVLEPKAGLHAGVQVFDFRSLYPSLMRTFGIDPLAHIRARGRPESEVVRAPNGAAFLRERGILPRLIDEYYSARTAAQEAGDETASFVYKILMNSFYGVLGSGDCRYGRTELAGAVTSWGRKYLNWTRDWFEARGMEVLYGDTDSVFVRTGGSGSHLARQVTRDIALSIRQEYGLESYLELRAEKTYRRFLIPRMRGQAEGPGRAKGYAGWLEKDGRLTVDVKGMEAVRSDWTPLARRVQVELLERIFQGQNFGILEEWRRDLLGALRRGELNRELVYRKVLRRPARDYTANQPPQVKAARLLGWTDRRGRIDYVITREGPRPVDLPGLPPDPEHYVDHQIRPLWESLMDAAGLPLPESWDNQGRLEF